MNIGIDCFNDTEIRAMISSQHKKGNCDITGKENTLVYDTEVDYVDLPEYLSEIIDVYTPESELIAFPESELGFIQDILYRDWSIFNVEPTKIRLILHAICKNIYPANSKAFTERVGIEEICDNNYMDENCITKQSSWDKFVSSLKTINRFHSSHINLKQLKRVFENSNFQYEIKKGEKDFFRGRISPVVLDSRDMGAPPAEKATAGRVNANGIRCLYLASDEMTTLHEIRARDLDDISMGQFEAKRNLTLIDLAELDCISPFRVSDVFSYEWLAINMPILKKISKEIAKPLRRQDSELDYLPSQYITDYIKSLGYDGVRYKSTLNKSGFNYAIFDQGKFKYVGAKLVHVESLVYNTRDY